jgi:hypothetical protein
VGKSKRDILSEGDEIMTKRILVCAVVLAFVAGLSLSAVSTNADDKSWTGYVTDSMCAAKGGASVKDSKCATMCVNDHGGKWVLYTPGGKKAMLLAPADKVAAHAGHYVTVTGTVDGDTITVATVTMTKEPEGSK